MIGGGSYYKGWASNIPGNTAVKSSNTVNSVYMGHVLETYYNDTPGKIRIRLVHVMSSIGNKESEVIAYPINLNMVKYPLPGELVTVIETIQPLTSNNVFTTRFCYMATITSNNSITFNSDPYVGMSVLEKSATRTYTDQFEYKYETRFKSIDSFVLTKQSSAKSIKERQQLQPKEGDYIIQSRFGSSIRLGSTTLFSKDEWSKQGGGAGDGITILSVNRSLVDETSSTIDGTKTYVESINELDSAIYATTSQTIPVELATSENLKTHLYRYDVKKSNITGSVN